MMELRKRHNNKLAKKLIHADLVYNLLAVNSFEEAGYIYNKYYKDCDNKTTTINNDEDNALNNIRYSNFISLTNIDVQLLLDRRVLKKLRHRILQLGKLYSEQIKKL